MVGTCSCESAGPVVGRSEEPRRVTQGGLNALCEQHLLAGRQHPALAADVPAVRPVVLPELAPHLVQQILQHDDMRKPTLQ